MFAHFCCKPLRFTAGLEGFHTKVFGNDLRIAQLVERETVRVALYLEVACSTQALEIPFAEWPDFILLYFPRTAPSHLAVCR